MAVGIGKGEGAKQRRIHHAEDRGIGADAQREDDHRDGHESRALAEIPNRVAKIGKHA
jgi:hypothetical protein